MLVFERLFNVIIEVIKCNAAGEMEYLPGITIIGVQDGRAAEGLDIDTGECEVERFFLLVDRLGVIVEEKKPFLIINY